MFSIIFATNFRCADDPWLCVYEEYEEILKASLEKMTGMNIKELFNTPTIQKIKFSNALNEVINLENEHAERVREILNRCVDMCTPEDKFTVYFLPLPFNPIMTNYSPNKGTFILYGVSEKVSYDELKIYLPHEYAHVVRLQKVLLPEGKDSPYKMTLGELAIFEGLGVVFSMVFNNEISERYIAKYAGVETYDPIKDSLLSEFMKMKDKTISELPAEIFQKYYSERSKLLYRVGASLILKLVSAGYSVCSLNRMNAEDIMEKINPLLKS